ncbi:NUDIX hydrolase, partial [Streptomyces sp. TRM76130]|nr:NUDIX hydrolase [Streptomyces sp. TRM76130]
MATYSKKGGITVQWTNQYERIVYSNRWFSVNLADVELPDGRRLDH